MAGQRTYNSPNPLNYNYPKMMHIRGTQYGSYPSFKEGDDEKPIKPKDDINSNLAKELEKQIQELQKVTKEAKELAKKVNI